jgi:hypothetical protein
LRVRLLLNESPELSRFEVGQAQKRIEQLRQSIWQHGELRAGRLFIPTIVRQVLNARSCRGFARIPAGIGILANSATGYLTANRCECANRLHQPDASARLRVFPRSRLAEQQAPNRAADGTGGKPLTRQGFPLLQRDAGQRATCAGLVEFRTAREKSGVT